MYEILKHPQKQKYYFLVRANVTLQFFFGELLRATPKETWNNYEVSMKIYRASAQFHRKWYIPWVNST
jgi:hypothetical protein